MKGKSPTEMLRLAESLVYEKEPAAAATFETMAARYVSEVSALPADQQDKRKDEILSVLRAFKYLARSKVVPASFAPIAALDRIEQGRGWDQKKK